MSAAPLRVTVAICTYHRAGLLRQTLEGLARQDYPADAFEILVIDNTIRPTTPGRSSRPSPGTFPAPRWILGDRQAPDHHARNRAVAEGTGDIIIFGDDDILVGPDWVRQLAAPFAADLGHRIGCVGGEVIPVFPDGAPDWVAQGISRPSPFAPTPGRCRPRNRRWAPASPCPAGSSRSTAGSAPRSTAAARACSAAATPR